MTTIPTPPPHDAEIDAALTQVAAQWGAQFQLQLTPTEQTGLVQLLKDAIPALTRDPNQHKHVLELVSGQIDPEAAASLASAPNTALKLVRLSVPGGWIYTVNDTPIYVPKPQAITDQEARERVLYVDDDGVAYDEQGTPFGRVAMEDAIAPALLPSTSRPPDDPILLAEYANMLTDIDAGRPGDAWANLMTINLHDAIASLTPQDWLTVVDLIGKIAVRMENPTILRDQHIYVQALDIPETATHAQDARVDVVFMLNQKIHGAPVTSPA